MSKEAKETKKGKDFQTKHQKITTEFQIKKEEAKPTLQIG